MREGKMKICQCGCGEEFVTKRKDKKYLNRKHQVNANNERQYFIHQMMGGVTTILKKNFLILRNLLKGQQKQTVSIQFLRGKGFNFNHITELDNDNDKTAFFVYDFKLSFNNELVTIENCKPWK
jgi:hypothetical protein